MKMMMMMTTIIIIIIIMIILRKVLTQRYNGVNAGTNDIGTMNSYIRIVATQCSLGTWFVPGI
jgi:uncharacterized membrane protein